MNVEDMTLEDATLLAASYAHKDAEVKALQADMKKQRALLEQWMGLNKAVELIDDETATGVKYGKPSRKTTWDTLNMPADIVAELHSMNLLDVRTTAIDKLKGTARAVDEAMRYRMDGETAPPFEAVRPK